MIRRLIYRIVATFISILLFSNAYSQGSAVVYLPIDYIEFPSSIILPNGDEWVCNISSNSGVTLSNINNAIAQAMEDNLVSEIISSMEVIEWSWNIEGSIRITFNPNTSGECREITFMCGNNDYPLTQNFISSPTFSLSSNKTILAKGESAILTLSGSVNYAKYALYRNNTMVPGSLIIGSGQQITFKVSEPGEYTCRSIEPTEIVMNGSVTLSNYTFYNGLHHSSLGNRYNLSPNGQTLTIPFTPSSSNTSYINQLNSILSTYSSGGSTLWKPSMKISYFSGTLTVVAAPNLSDSTIINNTFFKTNNADSLLIFTQNGRGKLLSYNCHYEKDNGGNGNLILDSSQYLVEYYLIKEGVGVSDTIQGTGEGIIIPLTTQDENLKGKYSLIASYQGEKENINGFYITSSGKIIMNDNFIVKETLLNNRADSSYVDITYYDGLGYPIQVINIMGSPSKKHIVQPITYDKLRRNDAKSYLPFSYSASQNNDVIAAVDSSLVKQNAFYTTLFGEAEAQYPFTEKVYQGSLIGKVKEEILQGSAMRATTNNHSLKHHYLSNGEEDVLNIYLSTNSQEIIVNGFLPRGTLYKHQTISPDSIATTVYSLSDGRVVSNVTYSVSSQKSDTLITYHIYDNLLRERYIITPKGVSYIMQLIKLGTPITLTTSFIERYCYSYEYDGRGRTIYKHIPNGSTLRMLYDNADRLIAKQDGLLKEKDQWLYTLYDAAGRALSEHLVYAPDTSALRTWITNQSNKNSIYNHNNLNKNILLKEWQHDQVNFSYQDEFANHIGFYPKEEIVSDVDLDGRNTSLLVLEKELEMGSLRELESTGSNNYSLLRYKYSRYYYDSLARIIQKVSLYPKGEKLFLSNKYGFNNNILLSIQELSSTDENNTFASSTIKEEFHYDHRLRATKSSVSAYTSSYTDAINNQLLSQKDSLNFKYDELGHIEQTTISTSNKVTVKSVNNIQNWLTSLYAIINREDNNGNIIRVDTIYSQLLRYYSTNNGAKPLFGGGISEWDIRQAIANATNGALYPKMSYLFAYDGLGRLSSNQTKIEGENNNSNKFTERNISYDLNGNILSLSRYGADHTTPNDNLTYTYDGDRLLTLSGIYNNSTLQSSNGSNTYQYVNYFYDQNGNTTSDGSKGIALSYNQLNQLSKIADSVGKVQATYSFFAGGEKYEVIDSLGRGRRYIGTFSQKIENEQTSQNQTITVATTDKISSSSTLLSFYLTEHDELPAELFPENIPLFLLYRDTRLHRTVISTHFAPIWKVADHLGSVRVILDSLGSIIEQNDYYPFGLRHNSQREYPTLGGDTYSSSINGGNQSNLSTNNPSNRLKFNGKELQTALTGVNYIDYGARMYDPTTARWTTQDPLAEKYKSYSPYSYCIGNPIKFVDPDGKDIVLYGSKKAQNTYVKMLYASTGNFYAIVDNKLMFVETDANFNGRSSQTLVNIIQSGINAKEIYTINLVGDKRDDKEVFIDSYSEKKIDISDLKTIGKASSALQGALIGHFLNEVQVGEEFNTAHKVSLEMEGMIYGELIGDNTIKTRVDYPLGPPQNGIQNVIFEYNARNKFQLQQGANSIAKKTVLSFESIEIPVITIISTGELNSAKKLP